MSRKILVILFLVPLLAGLRAGAAQQIDFNRDVRPILSDKCFACHGPDAPAKKIGLRLDSENAAKGDLGRGRRAIVPGKPDESELVRRITAADELERMPPVYSGHQLTKAEIDLLIEWIRQGAQWQKHWSFVAPVRPHPPAVRDASWPENPIDNFILHRLEREGLRPSPEADRATLIRRLSLDLTGLPPTPLEVDRFLADRSKDAWQKLVDRLLASPRFGERMAFRWLDAARYADTNGYQIDGDRSMWRWRDWVIEAFNNNKPFDQFVIEQLAGDLLPNATLDQKIATAFNRNHRINAEGGIVPEEYRIEYVVDRVDTTSTVFMGLTIGCARCHNHKFDPFTQKEYYQLSAYFNNIPEDGHSFDQGNSPPLIAAPTREQEQRLSRYEREISELENQINLLAVKAAPMQKRWEESLLASNARDAGLQWFPGQKLLVRLAFDGNDAPVFNKSDRAHHEPDDKKASPGRKTQTGFKEGSPSYVPAPTGQGAAFDGRLFFDAGLRADFRYKSTSGDYRERFTIAAWVNAETEQSGSIITKVGDGPQEVENNIPRAGGYGLYFLNGRIHFNMVFRWGEDALRVETVDALPLGQWHHVAVLFDGLKNWDDRIRIYVDGRERKLKFNQRSFFLLFGNPGETLKIGAGGGPGFRFKGALDEVRVYSRLLDSREIAVLSCPDSLGKIAAINPDRRTLSQSWKIYGAFLEGAAPDELKLAHRRLRDLKIEKEKFEDDLPTLMVMEELPEPRPAYLLARGAYDAPGEKVERGIPAILPPLSHAGHRARSSTRLDFARWLVSDAHPLTARVAVNRLWQMIFGAGLVRTSEDFGTQGEPPSHPELLDWLAVEFRQGGWDLKAILKTIVTSATYRQSSKIIPELIQRDPDNRLLGRSPRLRLSAEMIRDQALMVSGLLVEKRGGPSVKPYQPEGIYKDMVFSGLTGYERDKGDGLWRRSLYTFWKRTVLAPNMQVFDASAREFCSVRETRTNTPLQSLNLLNDVTYLEASRMLAERMLREGGPSAAKRLAWAFRAATSRNPGDRELEVLLRNLEMQEDYFADHPAEAEKLLAFGDKRNDPTLDPVAVAAYTAAASLILNLDEVITRQ